ncbi:acyltransferase [Euzebyella marina]|uniref:Acyltransferase n=1 Tax=Euzebyella marina TaxID=1761453 RepID=A0A3G2L350_9FLAO|nr:acyltransferase [Euzebyella marina]AYN66665.1 acyltransferase [Euzebyella marina]
MKKIFSVLIIFLPWGLRRYFLLKIWNYDIHPSAKIGLAYVYPRHLIMEEGSKIEHFNIAIHLDSIIMGRNSSINRSNWITGFPTLTKSQHFNHQSDRKSSLVLGKEASITKKHHLDCTNQISIGNYTTIAGYHSQLLTHSVNIYENRQDSLPITIGDYCFVGTNCTILGGAALPNNSVLGAKSLLNKKFIEEFSLYAGVPTLKIKEIDSSAKYFHRKTRFII